MDESVSIIHLLRPILQMCLKKEEIQMLEDIQPDVEYLLIKSLENFEIARFEECISTVTAVLDLTWEELNTGHWSLVAPSLRSIYAAASLLKVVAQVQFALLAPTNKTVSCLQEAVHTADLGLLMGNSHREHLTTAARLLSQAINHSQPKVERGDASASCDIPEVQVSTAPVAELHCPSLETFSAQHFYPRVPVKITGCMKHWAALSRWQDLDYLLSRAGSRTVPVELGSSYSQEDWSQRLMTLRQFITLHVAGSSSEGVGYLAQHNLFDQVPELRKDIAVPDYCACSETEEEVDINAWFGPGGTVSPLHQDPKHNLLSQVVGSKRVVLYSPAMSDRLYPHPSRLLANTAQVDPENPDYKLFPKYHNTPAVCCHLSPGEMLYIPPCWWHHVRALEMSFSVSFWWT